MNLKKINIKNWCKIVKSFEMKIDAVSQFLCKFRQKQRNNNKNAIFSSDAVRKKKKKVISIRKTKTDPYSVNLDV